jgi:hypothetical protein
VFALDELAADDEEAECGRLADGPPLLSRCRLPPCSDDRASSLLWMMTSSKSDDEDADDATGAEEVAVMPWRKTGVSSSDKMLSAVMRNSCASCWS